MGCYECSKCKPKYEFMKSTCHNGSKLRRSKAFTPFLALHDGGRRRLKKTNNALYYFSYSR